MLEPHQRYINELLEYTAEILRHDPYAAELDEIDERYAITAFMC
jgi:hypothetical protein